MTTKTHFQHNPDSTHGVCGRPASQFRRTRRTSAVTCIACMKTSTFELAKSLQEAAAEAAFQAQEPHTVKPQFGRVNADGVMECRNGDESTGQMCLSTLWRQRPGNRWSEHYVCAACGHSVHPLTETGMSE